MWEEEMAKVATSAKALRLGEQVFLGATHLC